MRVCVGGGDIHPATPRRAVNKRLPGWQNPPSRDAIRKALAVFDTNKDGVLSQREFESFSKDLVQCGPDAFFKRTAQNYLLTTGVLPAAAVALKKLASNELGRSLGLGAFSGAPSVILAPALGATVKMIRGLIPV